MDRGLQVQVLQAVVAVLAVQVVCLLQVRVEVQVVVLLQACQVAVRLAVVHLVRVQAVAHQGHQAPGRLRLVLYHLHLFHLHRAVCLHLRRVGVLQAVFLVLLRAVAVAQAYRLAVVQYLRPHRV